MKKSLEPITLSKSDYRWDIESLDALDLSKHTYTLRQNGLNHSIARVVKVKQNTWYLEMIMGSADRTRFCTKWAAMAVAEATLSLKKIQSSSNPELRTSWHTAVGDGGILCVKCVSHDDASVVAAAKRHACNSRWIIDVYGSVVAGVRIAQKSFIGQYSDLHVAINDANEYIAEQVTMARSKKEETMNEKDDDEFTKKFIEAAKAERADIRAEISAYECGQSGRLPESWLTSDWGKKFIDDWHTYRSLRERFEPRQK
jgi:formylmethanofuran dehydrogenase subunit E